MQLTICVGDSCHLKGAEYVVKTFLKLIKKEKLEKKINLKGSFCMGQCSDDGITVQIDGQFHHTTHENAETFFYEKLLPTVKT